MNLICSGPQALEGREASALARVEEKDALLGIEARAGVVADRE